jgi:hypothetical protein
MQLAFRQAADEVVVRHAGAYRQPQGGQRRIASNEAAEREFIEAV